MGRHSLLVQSSNSAVARNAAANKQIRADAQTARAAYSKRYMSLASSFFLLSICLFSANVFAGGSYFPIKITDFQSDGTKFVLVATVIDESLDFYTKGCDTIEVTGNFEDDDWIANNQIINLENHQKAIQILRDAYENKKQINIGYIGQGFYLASKCSFFSKGIFHDEMGVYSIYGRI